jgi:hypothetical protein
MANTFCNGGLPSSTAIACERNSGSARRIASAGKSGTKMQAKGMGSVVSRQSPVVSCYQLLAISHQPSAISHQPSAISHQLSATHYQPLPALKGTGFSRSEKVETPGGFSR